MCIGIDLCRVWRQHGTLRLGQHAAKQHANRQRKTNKTKRELQQGSGRAHRGEPAALQLGRVTCWQEQPLVISAKQGANRLKCPQEARISGKQMNLQLKMKMKTTQLSQLTFLISNSITPQYTDLSLLFHSFPIFTLCSLSGPWVSSSSPASAPLSGLILASLVPLCSICNLWFLLYQTSELPRMPLFPHHSWVKNLMLGVNVDYLYEVCLYIQAQTHREYIKAHLNAVWYFRRLSQGEK